MTLHYSRYAALPVDRDVQRIEADLRALPTPAPQRPVTRARRSWLPHFLRTHRTRHA